MFFFYMLISCSPWIGYLLILLFFLLPHYFYGWSFLSLYFTLFYSYFNLVLFYSLYICCDIFLKFLEFLPLFVTVSEEFIRIFFTPFLGDSQCLHPVSLRFSWYFAHFPDKHWFSHSCFSIPLPIGIANLWAFSSSRFCLYVVFVASKFVGRAALASVSADNTAPAASLSHKCSQIIVSLSA